MPSWSIRRFRFSYIVKRSLTSLGSMAERALLVPTHNHQQTNCFLLLGIVRTAYGGMGRPSALSPLFYIPFHFMGYGGGL